ncbi:MAG TPA: glycosyltransferase [Acidimicrobiia bacterium]|nr:glycosyltransferase [Acidimicrobiia bacterium]
MLGQPATQPRAERRTGRRRIALFLPDLPVGGVERVFANLAGGLRGHDAEVELVVGDASGPARALFPDAMPVADLHVSRSLRAVPGLVRHLRRSRPDALISAKDHTNVVAVAAAALSRTHVPVIVTVHAPLSEAWRAPERRTGRAVPALALRAYRRAAAVVAVSEGIAAELRRQPRLRNARVEVVPNPVVDEQLLGARGQVPDHPWFRERTLPVVVAVGRLEAQKDFSTLLHAIARLRARRPVRTVVVGDGSERGTLEALARDLGLDADVAFTGARDDATSFLAASDVVVLSSRYEGMPTVLVEALALGCRVVATDCPTGPRELLADGAYGRLVPVGDAAALADAVDGALADPRPALPPGHLAPFTPAVAAGRYLAIVDAVRRR